MQVVSGNGKLHWLPLMCMGASAFSDDAGGGTLVVVCITKGESKMQLGLASFLLSGVELKFVSQPVD